MKTKEKALVDTTAYQKRKRETGVSISKNTPSENEKVEYACLDEIVISIPWTRFLSKNVIFGRGGNQNHRVYMKQESRTVREQIAWMLRSEVQKRKRPFVEGKIWLDIFVQKPTNVSDAINTLDLIADAVKDALGVDDKWYSVRGIDWEIKKENPMITIRVGQEEMEPQKICSYCGCSRGNSHFTGETVRICNLCKGR